MRKDRFTMPVTVHLLLIKEGKILLLRRFNTGYEDGKYSVVAGHLDGNEEVVDAMIREAREEAGIVLSKESLKISGVMHRKAGDASNERIDFFLMAGSWEGSIQNMEPHKCDDLSWFDIKELPENIIPYVKRGINNYLENISFDSFGW